ncbi:MAG: phenylalanine--tRNA ligase subunit beta [Bdellovibrionales bacterium]
MKFTINWLKRHLETDASLDAICETLTAIGLEVEGVIDNAARYAPFTVAAVTDAQPHPDADKLQILTVRTANHGTQQIVCGAPNARAGMKGIFAPEGTYIPGLDVTLKKAKIRGVESCGMMVSEKEMQLSDEHKGIIEVDDAFEIGTPLAAVYGLDDPVIEINVTPNRADCAGVRGIARDLAAAGLGALKPLQTPDIATSGASPINVTIADEGCGRFLGRTITGVKNGPSPAWLQALLKAVGLRPISALVDITNFICLDLARPLHVYDADKLSGDITVRKTKDGEAFSALNDKDYTVNEGAIGIYDDSGLLGLGGIVGGTSTGCGDDTANVFLECAYFDPARIARAGRDLGVTSDARYRFERGVDPAFLPQAMEVFTAMVQEICGGQAGEIISAGAEPQWQRDIDYDPAYVKHLIGVDVGAARQKTILEDLGFTVSGNGPFTVQPPSWRGDIDGRADLVEEVIRIVGFDDIPAVSVQSAGAVPMAAETKTLSKVRAARACLTARGLHECVSWSFISGDQARAFGANDNAALAALTLQNPISSEMDVMRPSILPNLIAAAGRNAARGFADVALCEIGPVFDSPRPDGQSMIAAGIRAGSNAQRHWSDSNAARNVDVYDAKADALAALEACGAPAANAQISRDASDYFHPGRSGVLRLGKNVLAQFGEIHPAVLEEMDVKGPIVGFEVFLDTIPQAKKKGSEKPLLVLPPLQHLTKDFAFIVDEGVEADGVIRAAKAADKKLITAADVFDVYQGKGVESGKKSIALSVTIQPSDDTLTDQDLESLMQNIIASVADKTGGVLRG